MTIETLERTAVVDGEGSVSAGAETRSETAGTAVGHAEDPEVAQVAKRRKHSSEYKLRILEEIDNNPGKTGIILRREGLYSSYLRKWKNWKNQMNKPQRQASSPNKQLHNELAKAQRENNRLRLKLQRAEGVIELQKKASEILNMMSKGENEDN